MDKDPEEAELLLEDIKVRSLDLVIPERSVLKGGKCHSKEESQNLVSRTTTKL